MNRIEEVVAGVVAWVALGRGRTDEEGPEPVTQELPFVRRGGAEAELARAMETTPSTGSFLICNSCPQFPIRHRCEGCTKAAS